MSSSSNRGESSRGRGRGGGGGCWRGQGRGRGQYFSGYRNNGRGRGTNRAEMGGAVARPRQVQASIDNFNASPYKGWHMYMKDEGYSDGSPTVAKVQTFEKYFVGQLQSLNKDEIERRGSILLDYKDLIQDDGIQEVIPSLASEIREMPSKILQCLGLAMHQVLTHDLEQQALLLQQQTQSQDGHSVHVPALLVSVPYIHARLLNYEPVTPLKNLKANYYGKFVTIKGTVVRVSNIKPMCTKMAFQCNSCGQVQTVALPEGKYVIPTKCASGSECRGRSFIPLRSCPQTETIDWQTVKVQEIMTDDQREAGRIPRTVECELTQDLVDSCVPGDMVTISGVVKVTSSEDSRSRNNKDKCMFLLYIDANSVNNSKGNKKGESNTGLAMDFTIKELYAIQAIQSEKNLLRLIVGSMCPAIYGHEMVKAGLILGLFGGTHKFVNDKNRIPVRGDPHILVVGDPGLGKSQMLQAVSNIAPRGVYVCGNTTTTSGLTVTLTKDGSSGDFALEAGALVLGDQGCCCIDEFDKMGNQHQALLEAMEQQSISIAKAGIVCSLPARTSILAAANPVAGHYNKAKTVSENLKMGSALLSRFDLVFILLDKADEEMDCMLSEHVMALHAGGRRPIGQARVDRNTASSQNDVFRQLWEEEKPMSERLKIGQSESYDPVPHQLLRKYVGYARKYVHPKLTAEAASVLQKFYLELRKQRQGPDSTPITTRQLESLIRLTEARARLELREKATEKDAEDVVEIMKYSMLDTYSDEFGLLDFQRSQHGSGMSSRSQSKKFIAVLNRVAEQTYNSLFTVQQMRQIAREAGIVIPDFENFIASLNNQSYLLKKGPRMYQLQTANY